VRQFLVEPLYCDVRNVHVNRSYDHSAAVENHVGAALLHDRLQYRVERDFELTRGIVEPRLDLRLTLLNTGLKCLLFGGEILFLLGADIGGKNCHLLLQRNGFLLKPLLLASKLSLSLLGKVLRLGDHVLAGRGPLQNKLAIDDDNPRRRYT